MSRKPSPWAYEIDYDKAIAEDERIIATYTRAHNFGFYKPEGSVYAWSLDDLCIISTLSPSADVSAETIAHAAQVVETLGLSRLDIANLAAFLDREVAVADEAAPGSWYRDGEAVSKRLEKEWSGHLETKTGLVEGLRLAKLAFSRHSRNRLKYARK